MPQAASTPPSRRVAERRVGRSTRRARHMRILSRRQALCVLVPRSHMFRHPRRRVVDACQAMRPLGPLGEACPCPARAIRQAPPGAPMLFPPPFNT